ncbi:MAG: helix-turn-helix transcriptional regulator [Sinobacteraceae bacterium]|nr:helix-turn-helix transcriptional regulator [Nevskiaceae bacterium]
MSTSTDTYVKPAATTPAERTPACGPPVPLAMSFSELQGIARRGGVAQRVQRMSEPVADPALLCDLAALAPHACSGLSEVLDLSDDLLLVRSDFSAGPETQARSRRWCLDTRGWLYLHFRLDGLTREQAPDGRERTLGGGAFLLATASRPQSLVREVLSDQWRVVTIAFRPSFADRDLKAPEGSLPTELRRFKSGDATDFFYASHLTADMNSAVRSLLTPSIRTAVRPIYLRAKVVELVCLAIEQLQEPMATVEPPLKLSHRDSRALEEARRVLDSCLEPVSLEQLARRVGLNRRKLALGFKMLFGATVGEYHRDVRLETAYRMLASATASVAYASHVAGYSDVGSFGKAFRARYGTLPSAVRPSASARRLGLPRK